MERDRILEMERKDILKKMDELGIMRRGTVNEQFFDKKHKDGCVTTIGPYYLYSRTEKKKSFSLRISVDKVGQYSKETENCRKFKELANRYVLVCEELADLGIEEKKRPKHGRKS